MKKSSLATRRFESASRFAEQDFDLFMQEEQELQLQAEEDEILIFDEYEEGFPEDEGIDFSPEEIAYILSLVGEE